MSSSIRIVDMPDLGAFTSTSSIVGERAGSGRFSASALAGYFLPIAGGNVTGDVDIGYTPAGDWLTPLNQWAVRDATLSALSVEGQQAVVGGSQTLQGSGSYDAAIGVAGFGFNNFASVRSAWGGYFEARQYIGGNSAAFGVEIEIANISGVAPGSVTPYQVAGDAYAIQLGSGAGLSLNIPAYTPLAASVALHVVNNDAAFDRGLVFGATSLTGTNGNDAGAGEAISLASNHIINWYKPNNTVGAQIVSTMKTGAENFISFTDTGLVMGNTAVPTQVQGAFKVMGNAGFNGATPIAKPTVTGSSAGNAALGSLLLALQSYGLIVNGAT